MRYILALLFLPLLAWAQPTRFQYYTTNLAPVISPSGTNAVNVLATNVVNGVVTNVVNVLITNAIQRGFDQTNIFAGHSGLTNGEGILVGYGSGDWRTNMFAAEEVDQALNYLVARGGIAGVNADGALNSYVQTIDGGVIGAGLAGSTNCYVRSGGGSFAGASLNYSTNCYLQTGIGSISGMFAQGSRDSHITSDGAAIVSCYMGTASNVIAHGDVGSIANGSMNGSTNCSIDADEASICLSQAGDSRDVNVSSFGGSFSGSYLPNSTNVQFHVDSGIGFIQGPRTNVDITVNRSMIVGTPTNYYTNTFESTVAVLGQRGEVAGFTTNALFAGGIFVTNGQAQVTNWVFTSATNYGSAGRTNLTYTDTTGWWNTNSSAANQGVNIQRGNITAGGIYTGNASGLTNMGAASITGTITNPIVSPSITGNGSGLTNVPYKSIFTGFMSGVAQTTTGKIFPLVTSGFAGYVYNAGNDSDTRTPLPRSGTFTNLQLRAFLTLTSGALGTGTNVTIILHTNGVASSFFVTLSTDGSAVQTNSGTQSLFVPDGVGANWRFTNQLTTAGIDISWSVLY